MIGSRAWRALMRRDLVYRKRNLIGSLLEFLLPVGFVCILVAIKASLDDNENFSPQPVEAEIRTNEDAFITLSFTDYVTAIQAQRICVDSTSSPDEFDITGMPINNYNWQVPFVKCDSRACKARGEDARSDYCEYPVLAVAPKNEGDSVALGRLDSFRDYVYTNYPVLNNQTALPFNYSFIQEFNSSNEIDSYVTSDDYGTTGFPKIALAILFEEGSTEKDYAYTLRVNSTNFNAPESEGRPATVTTPDTSRTLASYAKKDNVCTPLGGTANMGPYMNSCTGQYMYNGAITIQRLIGDWIMSDSGAEAAGYRVAEHGVQFLPFPTKYYVENGFYATIAPFAPLLVILGLMYPVAAVIRSLTLEKELRQKELMKMMSVQESDIGWSWFLSYFLFHLLTTVAMAGATIALYSNSDFVFLFIFWFLTFIAAVTVFGIFIASFLTKSTRAVLVGLLLFFIGYFLIIAADIETGSGTLIQVLSLHPVTAFSYGMVEIGRLEDAGQGLNSSTFNQTDSPSGYTFATTIVMLMFDSILWSVIAWYLNRVVPSDYGTPLAWYFPFTTSYWCPGTAKAPMDDNEVEDKTDPSIPIEPISNALKQQDKEGKSVQIKDLRKVYGEKIAVDGLSLSMYSGQVTALLGHNGAGKTTTINMLTGMVKPTSGYALVAGKDIRTQMNQIRKETGICLQHDCLFPQLTVKEHIEFFARVKGMYAKMSKKEAEEKVMTSIEDVALMEKRNTLSKNLSGGMKRKLSVAIAFCGDSKTVLLDEPTSGMDPFSRRFTWNVIRQYREDRCIVLTTHFMDEADLLGDRIAIMSQGQLRCLGSPLFLKKAYGVGYQLTIEKNSPNSRSSVVNGSLPTPISNGNDLSDPDHDENGIEAPLSIPGADAKENGANGIDAAVPTASVLGRTAANDDELKDIVLNNVENAHLLSNVGTEMSFQLPLGGASSFGPMFKGLDKEVDEGKIATYGVSVTTLDEVFLMVARGDSGEEAALASSRMSMAPVKPDDDDKSARSRMNLQKTGMFRRHVRALFEKRALNFKRDKKAWCCSVFLPSIFVLIGFVIFKFASPSRNLEAMQLDLDAYNADITTEPRNPIPFNNPGTFSCQPGVCTFASSETNSSVTGEIYSFCGAGFFAPSCDGGDPSGYCGENCSIVESTDVVFRITEAGASGIGGDMDSVNEASQSVFDTSASFQATQYGALYYTHDSQSTITQTGENYGDYVVSSCQGIDRDYFDESSDCERYRGYGYVVSYNYTALHAGILYQSLGDEALVREALADDEFKISPTIHPLPTTAVEESFGGAEDAFTAWFLVVLSFPFISGSFATFVVAERQSKAKHLQTVAGVEPSAYWISTYLWDIANYQIPCWITIILMFAFSVETFTTRENGVIGGVITVLVLFGPATAGFTYCCSFLFKSPSMCNLFVIVFNFLIGMAGPLVTFILRLIGEDPGNRNETLVTVSIVLEWILRFIPSFCLGRGLFAAINIVSLEFLAGRSLSVWTGEVLLYEVIFLAVESFVYIALTIQIDKWHNNPRAVMIWRRFVRFITCRCCCGGGVSPGGPVPAPFFDDEDVIAEQDRVLTGQANDDLIVMDQLTKVWPPHKVAVNHMSLGIPPGQCFGLLGINGAGKTTTMGMLTAEFPPTSGDATLAGYSVTNEPEQTRRRIGYCPQFDALFQNMTGIEHVELYASIKGVPRKYIKEAANSKLDEMGLKEEDRNRLAAGYSGGMKRKLSVACATIGQPQIVFLDEPSTGMDPVARRDMWEVISNMVAGNNVAEEDRTSVILTTHSMEECEALCPRIGIMAGGQLKCLGSAQHLKTRFGQGFQVEMKLLLVSTDEGDYMETLASLQEGTPAAGGEEGGVAAEDVFFNLEQTISALRSLTSDNYLVDMIQPSNQIGYPIYKSALSPTGVSLDELASWATEELRMKNLTEFFESSYDSSVLRERQDTKVRYEIDSEGIRISQIFANIESHKEELMLADYGVSQTSLEQVFNMFAAKAEEQKQGTIDN